MAVTTLPVGKNYIAWIGPTTTINAANFSWYTPSIVSGIYAINNNRTAYISNKPGSMFPAVTQFVLASIGAPANIYEIDLKQAITLDSSLLAIVAVSTSILPTNFAITNLGATNIAYSWSAPGASTSVLQISTDSAFSSIVASYTGAAAKATITGLLPQRLYYARVKTQTPGLMDSDYATRNDTTIQLLNLNIIGEGDSITAGPVGGSGSSPDDAPIVYAANRIISPSVSFVKFGNPSKTTRWFLDNQKAAVLSAVASGKRNMLYYAYGANDIPLRTPSQRQADLLEFANWAIAQGSAFDGVLFIPVMNRLDTGTSGFSYSLEEDGTHCLKRNPRLSERGGFVLDSAL